MSQKLVVTVDASVNGTELATVQDVLSHVLELFQLVSESDPMNDGKVAWRLVSATMNSPLTVVAEAVPRFPNVAVDPIAARQVSAFVSNYSELRQGRIPAAWSAPEPRRVVTRLLQRNRQIIGLTRLKSVDGPDAVEVEITPADARLAVSEAAKSAPQPTVVRTQIGSLEGHLLQVQRYYGHPAIQIRERKTKAEIWCVVPEEFQHEISQTTSVEDVWKGSRVLVKGKILYGTDGKIARVEANSVRRIEPEVVLEDAIVDKEFTGGLSVSEYLERFRDGKLGKP